MIVIRQSCASWLAPVACRSSLLSFGYRTLCQMKLAITWLVARVCADQLADLCPCHSAVWTDVLQYLSTEIKWFFSETTDHHHHHDVKHSAVSSFRCNLLPKLFVLRQFQSIRHRYSRVPDSRQICWIQVVGGSSREMGAHHLEFCSRSERSGLLGHHWRVWQHARLIPAEETAIIVQCTVNQHKF